MSSDLASFCVKKRKKDYLESCQLCIFLMRKCFSFVKFRTVPIDLSSCAGLDLH